MTSSINEVMQKHLQQLSKEISAYKNESDIWLLNGKIANTAGNLCLHLCGNLLHFIGATLGDSGYERDREAEFATKDVPANELLQLIEKTKEEMARTLKGLDEVGLQKEYPIQVLGKPTTTEYFLIHLTSHLGYHLGQINYHRRILVKG